MYAGVFDPPTVAHLEIIESALRILDQLVVVVSFNPHKAGTLFTPEERVEMLEASLTPEMRPYVRVTAHAGLTAPFAESLGASPCGLAALSLPTPQTFGPAHRHGQAHSNR